MTIEEARRLKREKAEKRVKEDIARTMTQEQIVFNKEKNLAQKSGIKQRKREKENREEIRARNPPLYLNLLDIDPWVVQKEKNPNQVQSKEEKKRKKEERESINPRLLMKSIVAVVEVEYREEELMRDYIGFLLKEEDRDNQFSSESNSGKSDKSEDAIVVISRHR